MAHALADVAVRRNVIVFVGTLLLATGLRVCQPTLSEFKFSEARLAALALEVTHEGSVPLVGVPSSAGFDHSPLSVYLYVPAFLFTTSPIPATIYGGLIGVTAVVICWRFARRWPGGGNAAATISGLLLATSPWSVSFSRKIWQVVFVQALTLAVVGLAVDALTRDGRGKPQAWMVLGYAVLVQVHPSAISLAPAIVVWLILFRRRVKPGYLSLGGILALISGIPMLLHQAQNGWPVWAAVKSLPAAQWDFSAVWLAWEMITGRGIHALAGDAHPLLGMEPNVARTFNLIGWITLLSGGVILGRMVRNWRAPTAHGRRAARVDFILLSWFAMNILFNLRHTLELHLHFFALVAPGAFLIVGRGIQVMVDRGRAAAKGRGVQPLARRILVTSVGSLLFVLMVAQVLILILLGQFLSQNHISGGFGTPLSRYMEVADQAMKVAREGSAREVLIVGDGDSVVVHEDAAIFDVLLRERTSYRFVDGHSAALFPPNPTVALITPHAGRAADWYEPWPTERNEAGYSLVTLDGSWPTDEVTAIGGHRLFENGIEVQGFIWECERSESHTLWLLWQVLWQQPGDTHFSVRVRDQGGALLAQADASGYPSAYRRKGDRVLSGFESQLDVSQSLFVSSARVGVYRFPQVENLRVLDGSGNPVDDGILLDLRQPLE